MSLEGLIVPIPTLFTDDGRIELAKNASFARGLSEAKVDHLFVLGSLGEFPSIRVEERAALLESVIESLTPHVDAWVGCGAPSTDQAIRFAREAEDAGAAALVAVPPYYLHPTPSSVERYYRSLHAAVKLPLLAYNIPSLVGYPLSPGSVHALAREGVLSGIKDTAGSLESVRGFLAAAPDGFPVFPGDDGLAAESFKLGAVGAVMGMANIVPRLCVDLVRAARHGEWEVVSTLQATVDSLVSVSRNGPFPSTVKFLAQRLRGAAVGYRSPYDPLTPEEETRVLSSLEPILPTLKPFL